MSRMWICEGQLAEKPLAVNAGLSLYSFEELCYYLYQNAESVEESFYNEALCQWLSDELGMEELAAAIREGIEAGQNGGWCMGQILAAGGLYSHREITRAVSIVQSMESTSPAQRAKLRGDRLLRSGKYRKAWIEYQKALEEESDLFFKGRVWHNLGTLYARQFLFEAAGECYKRAYEIGQQTVSSEAYLFALTCTDGASKDLGPGSAASQRQTHPAVQSSAAVQKQNHLAVQNSAVVQNPGSIDRALEELREKKASGDRASYEDMLENLLLKLRLEYRKSE